MQNIIVATIKEWNILNYFKIKKFYKKKFNFHLITNKEELTIEYLKKLNPTFIFFPHWSWIINEKIYNEFNCVVFHMTDLPYGRGGSPFQNLILNEVYDTKISALKVDGGLDTGEIYLKENFNISTGSAEENFIKLSSIIFEKMIPSLLKKDLIPKKQKGKITTFQRRKPDDSNILKIKKVSINKFYDFIRMLDAEGYPRAYIKLDNVKIEFSGALMKDKKLVGKFEVIDNE